MLRVGVGDVIQVWLDQKGYQGRIGKITSVNDKGIAHLRLGDGDMVRLNMNSRTARIQGMSGSHKLRWRMVQRAEKKTPRFKRTLSV